MKFSEKQLRIAAFITLAIGSMSCVGFAFVWLDGALLKHPSAFARFLAAYLILAVAAVISMGRIAAAIVLSAALVVSWLGISAYVDWIRYPGVFDLGRFTWLKQCLLAILSVLIAGVSLFVHRLRHETKVT